MKKIKILICNKNFVGNLINISKGEVVFADYAENRPQSPTRIYCSKTGALTYIGFYSENYFRYPTRSIKDKISISTALLRRLPYNFKLFDINKIYP